MNIKKIAVVLIAVLAGGAAFYLTLSGQDTSEPAPVPIIQASTEKTVGVLVASVPVTRGQRLGPDSVEWRDWPQKVVEAGGVFITSDTASALEDLEGAVAKTSFVVGEPLIETKIVRAGSSGLMAAIMEPGMRAVAMRVTPETASGGFILPGDRVDVINAIGGGRDEVTTAETLFRNVRVLAVNEVFSEDPETSVIDGVNITLELRPDQAEEFVAARSEGKLSLSLRSIYNTENSPAQQAEAEAGVQPEIRATKKVNVIRLGRS